MAAKIDKFVIINYGSLIRHAVFRKHTLWWRKRSSISKKADFVSQTNENEKFSLKVDATFGDDDLVATRKGNVYFPNLRKIVEEIDLDEEV